MKHGDIGRAAPFPLSFAQQRLWMLSRMSVLCPADQIQFGLRLAGDQDTSALRRALARLVARHAALRASFSYLDNRPVQQIADDDVGFPLNEYDLRGGEDVEDQWQRLAAQDSARPFDLQTAPLARGLLIRLADREHLLVISVHRIACDERSIDVFKRELSLLYSAFRNGQADPLPKLEIQYPEYSVWQRQRLSGEYLKSQVEHWRRVLLDAPPALELPTDYRRPAQQDFEAAFVELYFDASLTAALTALIERRGTTLFAALLAAWAALLSRLSGQFDLVVGAPVAYRMRPDLEPLIGLFANELPLRIDLSGEPSAGELVDRVARTVREAHAHQDLRFEQIVESLQMPRSMAREPLFQSTFVWRDSADAEISLPGLKVTSVAPPARYTCFDLTLRLAQSEGRIVGELEYATALFDRTTVERYAGYLRRWLEGMAADDAQAIDRLPLLSEAERHRVLVEWNATEADYPQDRCVHELFEAQAARTPDAIAVVDTNRQLTYAELNTTADQLADRLWSLGAKPSGRVAVGLQRSIELVVAQLAILKCGGAYVPIDQHAPPERQAFIIKDCQAQLLLTDSRRPAPKGHSARRVDIDAPGQIGIGERAPVHQNGRSLIYVMYTSGSTGEPKGVMVPHRGVARLVLNNGYADFRGTDRVAFAANPAFDASTMEVWGALLNGGRVVIIDEATLLDPHEFKRRLERDAVTVLWLTAGLFQQYAGPLAGAFRRLRFLLAGGDIINPAIVGRVLESDRPQHLLNGYGPTETTTFAATYEVREQPGAGKSIPIGRPISNTKIYILDKYMEPAPIGVAGEIYIGGAGVADGYLERPELTAERFLDNPFVAGDRLYRTGDLGRYLADGNIEFLGRNDFQVKIRGFRIELGEIEARLTQHPSVREGKVLAREDSPGDKRLVAYFTVRPSAAAPDAAGLRAHLAEILPEYMVPAAYVRLNSMPLTVNGKLDSMALPAPETDAYAAKPYEAPRGETEEALARIFAAALKTERIGRDDNFFELGGDSLLGIRVVFEIEKTLGLKLVTASLFSSPTVSELAAALDLGGEGPNLLSLVPLHTRASGAPVFMIHLIERDVARHLGRRHPVYGLSYGLAAVSAGGEIRLPPDTEAAAAHYIEEMRTVQPHGPYRLLGHSLGGQIAYEMAQQLARAGETVEFLGLIDTDAPGQTQTNLLPIGDVIKNVLRTPPAKLLRIVNNALNKNKFVRRTKIRFLPTDSSFQFRLHDLMEAPYWPKPYSGRIDLFQATVPERYIRREPPPPVEVGWRKLAQGELVVHVLPGGHMDIVKDPVAAKSAEAMDAVLNALDEQALRRQKKNAVAAEGDHGETVGAA